MIRTLVVTLEHDEECILEDDAILVRAWAEQTSSFVRMVAIDGSLHEFKKDGGSLHAL